MSFRINKSPVFPVIPALLPEYKSTLITPGDGLLTPKVWLLTLLVNWDPVANSITALLKLMSNWIAEIASVLFNEIGKSKVVSVFTSLAPIIIVFCDEIILKKS